MIPKRTHVTEKLGWHEGEDANKDKPKNLVAKMIPSNMTMSAKRTWVEEPVKEEPVATVEETETAEEVAGETDSTLDEGSEPSLTKNKTKKK